MNQEKIERTDNKIGCRVWWLHIHKENEDFGGVSLSPSLVLGFSHFDFFISSIIRIKRKRKKVINGGGGKIDNRCCYRRMEICVI